MRARRPGLAATVVAAASIFAAAPASPQQQTVLAGVTDKAAESPWGPDDGAVYYYTAPSCDGGSVVNGTSPARIGRVPTAIGPARTVFEFNPPRPAMTCNPFRLESNLLVDATHVYWVDNQGSFGQSALKKLPRNANPGDAPSELKIFPGAPVLLHQLAEGGTQIFVIVRDGATSYVSQVDKTSPLGGPLPFYFGTQTSLSGVSFDGRWVWWLNGTMLQRYDTFLPDVQTVATGVNGYLSEGYYDGCSPLGCGAQSNPIYLAQGNQLVLTDTFSPGSPFVVFTSPRANVVLGNLIRDQFKVFFTELEPVGLFLDWRMRLFRHSVGFTGAALIYGPLSRALFTPRQFATDLRHLFFFDPNNGAPRIDRIANDAAAIPIHDVRGMGLEVSQGIQDRNNGVRLIAGKPTVVRFYVKAESAADVNDVTATLTGLNNLGNLGSLQPVNRKGKRITVKRAPARNNLDESFLFQLPDSWTRNGSLFLSATVNPFGSVLEDDPSDNTSSAIFAFTTSPRLDVGYVDFGYTLNGITYSTSYADVAASQLYLSKLYPLAYGSLLPAHPGLRFTTNTVFDDAIASRVAQTDKDCDRLKDDGATPPRDDRNLCAATYAGERIAAMRRSGDLSGNRYHYGNIAQAFAPDGSNPLFTRGFARGDRIGMGPSGPAGNDTYLNYAAHEVGHTLGRGHPFSGFTCGHSLDDLNFPYIAGAIGPLGNAETRVAGLDIGQFSFDPIAFRDALTSRDTMTYCGTYWISDYTFEGIYQGILANPAAPGGDAPGQAGAPIAGDWLIVTGTLNPSLDGGGFGVVRRLDAVADSTPPSPGGYTLELRGAGGALLASHGFSAARLSDGPGDVFAFELVVPFVAGTTQLRALETASSTELARAAVSASPPLIGNVALPGAPNPVDGMVTVTWTAIDPDGDPLRFDLFATRDGGATFDPIRLSVPASPLALDSQLLGGGPTRLRVVASDGVHTAAALSAPFTVAPRAPKVAILSPADGAAFDWSQLVTFHASASDLQDDEIPNASFVWRNAYGVLGTGRMLQTDALQVGTNVVTLAVTNSLGVSGQADVTVTVGDVLTPLPPSLSVAPTALAWSVANGETALQVGTIAVTNAGQASLVFDVASDAGWALVDGALGVADRAAPATLTITADPGLVPPGVTTTAMLTFRNDANPADVLQVPVSLSKGNVFEQTGAADVDRDGDPDAFDNCPSTANGAQADSDADGFGDACDDCRFAADPLQQDTGGKGAGSTPDGIGDACQCGDVTGDGRVTLADAIIVSRSLLVPPTATQTKPELCDVNGSGTCSLADAVVLRRALLEPPTQAIQPLCAPATP